MALRDINLIAHDILERRCLLRHFFLWCGGIAAVVVLALALYVYETRINYAAKQDLADVDNVQATLAAMVGEINRKQSELNLALLQRARFGALTAKKRSYSSVIAELAGIMNDQTWLKQLDLDAGRDGVTHLKLLGSSLSQEYLGNFIQRLSANPLFRGVVLKYSQESDVPVSGWNPVQFQIECDVSGG